jgi:hypothetical protein
MLKNTHMTNDQEDERSKLNKLDPHINRGFELMLRQNYKEEDASKPKSFRIRFCKLLSFFSREMHINFEFSIDIKK